MQASEQRKRAMDSEPEDSPAAKSPKTSRMFPVVIQELNGNKFALELDPESTVAAAKLRLPERFDDRSSVKLIHAGRILQDTRTIGKKRASRHCCARLIAQTL